MDIEELREEIQHYRGLAKTHQRNIRVLEQQKAQYTSLNVPPHIVTSIEDEQNKMHDADRHIAKLKASAIEPFVRKMEEYLNRMGSYVGIIETFKEYNEKSAGINGALQMLATELEQDFNIVVNPPIVNAIQANMFRIIREHLQVVMRQLEDAISQLKDTSDDCQQQIDLIKSL